MSYYSRIQYECAACSLFRRSSWGAASIIGTCILRRQAGPLAYPGHLYVAERCCIQKEKLPLEGVCCVPCRNKSYNGTIQFHHPQLPSLGARSWLNPSCWQQSNTKAWAAKKRFEISKFKFKFPRARTSELFRARSRLYRSQICKY